MNKVVYQLSARQLLLLAIASALIAIGATALVFNLSKLWPGGDPSATAFAESPVPSGISDPSTVTDEQNSIEVYRTISPGVAFISTTSVVQDMWGDVEQGRGNGSGSVIDTEGHILTNNHVVEGATKLTVKLGGEKVYAASVVGRDPDTDLAILKIDNPPAGIPVVPLGDSDKLAVGQKVLAIGNPFGLDRTLTTGVISGLERPIRGTNGRPIDAAIQTDASINPGNSGGPLLDKYGRMIGINSQILSRGGGSVGVGFAVPVNIAKRVIPQLLQYGEVRRPKLGASFYPVGDIAQQGYRLPVDHGLLIRQAVPGGAAERAGLKGLTSDGSIGDILLSADGQKINDMDDLFRLLDKKQIGDTVSFEIYRSGKTVSVPVKLLPSSANSGTPTRRGIQ
jgi:S1-C subfamily serine protease